MKMKYSNRYESWFRLHPSFRHFFLLENVIFVPLCLKSATKGLRPNHWNNLPRKRISHTVRGLHGQDEGTGQFRVIPQQRSAERHFFLLQLCYQRPHSKLHICTPSWYSFILPDNIITLKDGRQLQRISCRNNYIRKKENKIIRRHCILTARKK